MKNRVVPEGIHTNPQNALAERGFFHVGGSYVEMDGKHLMNGQMYVEVYVPKEVCNQYPLVLIHGADQSGLCWMTTPDGRPGWVDFFLEKGYVVYVVDQPARGRSVSHRELIGQKVVFSAEDTAEVFTQQAGDFPQAGRHTQWPGAGCLGDSIFDEFYAAQIDSIYDIEETQKLMRSAGKALLQKIGPSILVAHSQGGPFAWFLADDQPKLVKGIISIEPSGPPFVSAQTKKLIADENGKPLNYGSSHVPLTFEPPVSGPQDLELEQRKAPNPEWIDGYLQKEPARQLTRLRGIPAVVMTSESSYHAPYDYWTAAFLRQAGVDAEYLPLESIGIHGNGHMMMLEKNNLEVAAVLDDWIGTHVKHVREV